MPFKETKRRKNFLEIIKKNLISTFALVQVGLGVIEIYQNPASIFDPLYLAASQLQWQVDSINDILDGDGHFEDSTLIFILMIALGQGGTSIRITSQSRTSDSSLNNLCTPDLIDKGEVKIDNTQNISNLFFGSSVEAQVMVSDQTFGAIIISYTIYGASIDDVNMGLYNGEILIGRQSENCDYEKIEAKITLPSSLKVLRNIEIESSSNIDFGERVINSNLSKIQLGSSSRLSIPELTTEDLIIDADSSSGLFFTGDVKVRNSTHIGLSSSSKLQFKSLLSGDIDIIAGSSSNITGEELSTKGKLEIDQGSTSNIRISVIEADSIKLDLGSSSKLHTDSITTKSLIGSVGTCASLISKNKLSRDTFVGVDQSDSSIVRL